MTIRNFGLTRITMDQIHDIIKDVEDLKYNDAQYQMNNELQNRDAQSKKGIYSDDFSNTAQSDIYHAEWDARVNELGKFASPDRTAISNPLEVDLTASDASLFGSLALLPGSEQRLYSNRVTGLKSAISIPMRYLKSHLPCCRSRPISAAVARLALRRQGLTSLWIVQALSCAVTGVSWPAIWSAMMPDV